MSTEKAYIRITEDDYEPSDAELTLDFSDDFDYNTPYADNYDDITNVGEVFEVGGIFDDR